MWGYSPTSVLPLVLVVERQKADHVFQVSYKIIIITSIPFHRWKNIELIELQKKSMKTYPR